METPTFLVDVEGYSKRGERLGRMTGILNGEPRSFEKIDRPAMVKSEIVAGVIVDKFITVATYRITSQKQWEDLVEDKAVYFYEQAGDMVRMAVFD